MKPLKVVRKIKSSRSVTLHSPAAYFHVYSPIDVASVLMNTDRDVRVTSYAKSD